MTGSRRRSRRAAGTALAVVLVATGGPAAAQDLTTTTAPADTTATTTGPAATAPPSSAAEARREVTLAKADRAEVRQQLAAIDAQRATASAAFDRATEAVAAADRALTEARAAEEAGRVAAAKADAKARDAAVTAYVGDPGPAGALSVLVTGDAETLSRRAKFLEVHASHRATILAEQEAAHRALARATAERQTAADEADRQVATAQASLATLEAQHRQTVTLVAQLDDRVEAALAEASAMEALDAGAAGRLVADEQALRDAAASSAAAQVAGISASRKKVPKKKATKKKAAKPAPTTTAPRRTATTAAPRPVAVPATTPPTTAGPTTNTVPSTYAPPPAPATTVVEGIRVASAIAAPFQSLMTASAAAGMRLGGSGYRDPAIQIELRRAHCGPTDYDIWERPASECSPPTARPGRSMHEQGLAVDLTCNGVLIGSSADPCFVWLKANAATYGFFNLPSEPWHWSTNGN